MSFIRILSGKCPFHVSRAKFQYGVCAPISRFSCKCGKFSAKNDKNRLDERKELEEARKAGTAPALQDETGKDINPHIPQYISDAPWYYGASGPTLKHQRPQEERQKQFAKIDASYKRGLKETAAIKFRKGACENCGAITHKKKDCLERPRRVGAKFTGEDIKPDEYVPEQHSFDYDGKRDRWVGYDPEEHQRVLEEYQKWKWRTGQGSWKVGQILTGEITAGPLCELGKFLTPSPEMIAPAKQQLKSDKLHQDLMDGKKVEEKEKLSDDDDDDEDKYADDVIIPGQKFDSKR
ncbi:pre-mRNA-splicing factor SLU7-like [Xenia sp. Carnegie-2017]|uniref:pre-mRNA-splicing factor SLU7-like n=1 Tax=Xenia sp. Carnegie-2017 TaxID=2897299 RepID=UPI001F04FAA8|nr:pre-mRNA-splicing factor SLU7-like [Xenia sp. Carnegie-2017]